MELVQCLQEEDWEEDLKRAVEEKRRRRSWKDRLSGLILRKRRSGRYSYSDEEEEDRPANEDQKREDELPGEKMKEVKGDTDEKGEMEWRERNEEEIGNRKGKHLKPKACNAPGSPEDQENDCRERLSNPLEDPTDDEVPGLGCPSDDDPEGLDESLVKVYTRDTHPSDIFHTLREFRDSGVLTDLTLRSEDGGAPLLVHGPVLAAVSSLVRDALMQPDRAQSGRGGRREVPADETDPEFQSWSLSLGPELDHVGLQAVVEFAYSGVVAGLNEGTVARVQAAARTLGVPRVLELCEREAQPKASGESQKQAEGARNGAAEQMDISLRALNGLRLGKVGCDVVLEAAGGSLTAHRVVLCACSDFFRGMFTHGMKESRQFAVDLPLLLASELEALIGCSYSGTLPLSWECVFELTGTSLQLLHQPALSLCLSFLQEELGPSSCLDVASFARAYGMETLRQSAEDFVLCHFQQVARTAKFRSLPANQLLAYLNSRSLCVSSELAVFRAVAAWIQHSPGTRSGLARELMATVRFPLMTFREFKEVQASPVWAAQPLPPLFKRVSKDFFSMGPTSPRQHRVYLPRETLVLVGGDRVTEDLRSRQCSGVLWFGNSLSNKVGLVKTVEWRRLGEMPAPPRFSHEVAVLGGRLYVAGGRRFYGRGDILSSAYRFDPAAGSWERLSDMREQRCCFSLVVLGETLYAVGGDSSAGCLDSVERYCPATDAWSFASPLSAPVTGHSARALGRRVFLCGGFDGAYRCRASAWVYDPETGSRARAAMSRPRAHHCMEALRGRLYVAGGVTAGDGGDDGATVDQPACEVYDPAADRWSAIAPLAVPHVGAGSAAAEGRLYVLGGYSQRDHRDINMVHRYDPGTGRWEYMGEMPGPTCDIRAAVLSPPPQLRS